MSKLADLGNRLYRGEASYDFVGRRRVWYIISAVFLTLSIGTLAVSGLNLGISSYEGFVRQIIGWREYVMGMYWYLGPEYRDSNGLAADQSANCIQRFFSSLTATRQIRYIVADN